MSCPHNLIKHDQFPAKDCIVSRTAATVHKFNQNATTNRTLVFTMSDSKRPLTEKRNLLNTYEKIHNLESKMYI